MRRRAFPPRGGDRYRRSCRGRYHTERGSRRPAVNRQVPGCREPPRPGSAPTVSWPSVRRCCGPAATSPSKCPTSTRDGYATSTITATRSVLVRAIRRAQRDGWVARNVAELVPCPRGTRRESRSMTVAQVEQLLRAELSPWWQAYLYTGIMCGLRPGELLGLRWEDVDTPAGVIRIRKSVKIHEGDGAHDWSLRTSKRSGRGARSRSPPRWRRCSPPCVRTRPPGGWRPGPATPITAWCSPAPMGRPAGRQRPGRISSGSASALGSARTGTRTSSVTRLCRS